MNYDINYYILFHVQKIKKLPYLKILSNKVINHSSNRDITKVLPTISYHITK